MAQLCAPRAGSWIMGPAQRPPPPSGRDGVCSPSWSPASWDSGQGASPVQPGARPARRAGTPGRRGGRLGSGQRQSASEREKLRMRTLARALLELRRFLPPSVAPAGQSLTKIETLRLAIRYIGHLSSVLGLGDDGPRRRRRADAAAPRGCPLCPDPDGGPAPARTLSPGRGSAGGGGGGASRAPPLACPGPRVAPEPCDLSMLYAESVPPEGQELEPSPAAPLLTGDMLALLETWMPPSPQDWSPA